MKHLKAKAFTVIQQYFENTWNVSFRRIAFGSSHQKTSEDIHVAGDILPHDLISQEQLSRLESGNLIFIEDYSSIEFFAHKNILFVPLFLEDDFYGFMAIADLKTKSLSSSDSEFVLALRHVFELWIAKLNIAKRLEDLSNFFPSPTYLMNRRGEVTLWNEATEEMTGWRAERMLGKGNYENSVPFYGSRRPTAPTLIFSPDASVEAKDYLEFRREGKSVFSKAWCPALPGGGAFLTSKTSILYDINHREWGCAHTVRDVTRERQMEIDLRRSKHMVEAITDFTGIAIATFQDTKIHHCNQVFRSLFGIDAEDITVEDILDIANHAHPEDRYETSLNFTKLMKFRHPLKFHFRYTKKDALYHLRCYSQVEDYGDNPIVHLIVEDVTKQLALYEKARLNEVRMFHEDRLSALGVLTTGIAHELNQPLSTIKVITDSILYGKEEGWSLNEQELFENLEVISQQVSRMAGVIQNIRIYGREDRPQDQILVRPNDAIHNVLLMIGRQLEIAHIKLHKDFSPALPLIRTTLSRLEQVILNLVVNAQQAFENCGHKNRQIWIRSYSTDGEIIHIEIEDNAVGVPEALKVKIFDPFFTTKGVGQGTGMGLAISNSIVSELNGTIEVYNNDKGGATFAVVIPSARRDQ